MPRPAAGREHFKLPHAAWRRPPAGIGIALGRRSADLARAAAGLVPTEDAYPTVTAAVAKGRNNTAELRRAVAFHLGAKLALVTILVTALAAGLPIVFQAAHIVLPELFMDLGASVAFVAETAAPAPCTGRSARGASRNDLCGLSAGAWRLHAAGERNLDLKIA